MELIRKCCPTSDGHHGYTKNGHPVYIEKTGQINVDVLLSQFSDQEIVTTHIYQQETLMKAADLQSQKLKKTVDGIFIILDLEGLSLAHRAAVRFTEILNRMDEKYYPERMYKIFIINAPWVFPVIWTMVKLFMDPVTLTKVQIFTTGYVYRCCLQNEFRLFCPYGHQSIDCVRISIFRVQLIFLIYF